MIKSITQISFEPSQTRLRRLAGMDLSMAHISARISYKTFRISSKNVMGCFSRIFFPAKIFSVHVFEMVSFFSWFSSHVLILLIDFFTLLQFPNLYSKQKKYIFHIVHWTAFSNEFNYLSIIGNSKL